MLDLTPLTSHPTPALRRLIAVVTALCNDADPGNLALVAADMASLTPGQLLALVNASDAIMDMAAAKPDSAHGAFIQSLAAAIWASDASQGASYSLVTDAFLARVAQAPHTSWRPPPVPLAWLDTLSIKQLTTALSTLKNPYVLGHILARVPTDRLIKHIHILQNPQALATFATHDLTANQALCVYQAVIADHATVLFRSAATIKDVTPPNPLTEALISLDVRQPLPAALRDLAITMARMTGSSQINQGAPLLIFAHLSSVTSRRSSVLAILALKVPILTAILLQNTTSTLWPLVALAAFDQFYADPELFLEVFPPSAAKHCPALSSVSITDLLHKAPAGLRRHIIGAVAATALRQ